MNIFEKFINRTRLARVKNDTGERIETLRFTVPALRVGVLEYRPGELQTRDASLQGKTVRLYYPPEAVSDKEFLKTLENAPVVLGGHGKTTNEIDKDIDGWPRGVRYDETERAAMVDGTVKGKKGADYVRQYFNTPEFGASAFLDIQVEPQEGTTPEGESYNAIATKLRATHLALAPSVRDPENKIEIVNAVTINSKGEIKTCDHSQRKDLTQGLGKERNIYCPKCGTHWYKGKVWSKEEWEKAYNMKPAQNTNTEDKKHMELDDKTRAEITALVANTVKEVLVKNAEGEELADMKTAIAKMQEAITTLQKAVGSETAEREGAAEGENTEDKGKDGEEGKDGTLENTKPTQKIVAAFADAFNVDFGRSTPSFATLGNLAGIKAESPAELITAVNTKYAELVKAAPAADKTSAANTGDKKPFGGVL